MAQRGPRGRIRNHHRLKGGQLLFLRFGQHRVPWLRRGIGHGSRAALRAACLCRRRHLPIEGIVQPDQRKIGFGFHVGRGALRHRKPFTQRFAAHGLSHQRAHGLGHGGFVLEAHLQLVGVHVHIHLLNGYLQKQCAHGKAPHHHLSLAAFLQRAAEGLAAEEAPVDKEGLLLAVAAGKVPRAHIAGEQHAVHVAAHLSHFAKRLAPVEAVERRFHASVPHAVVDGLALADEAKRHIRP